jgi:hypothetical protein
MGCVITLYLLSSWRKALLEKLKAAQLIKNVSVFYGTPKLSLVDSLKTPGSS